MHFKFSKHALMQMERRGIKKELVEKIIHNPDKIIKQDKECFFQLKSIPVFQSKSIPFYIK